MIFQGIQNDEPYKNCIKDPTLMAILKYRKHPSIIAIRNKCKNKDSFSFLEIEKKEKEKEVLNLDANKASQNCKGYFAILFV